MSINIDFTLSIDGEFVDADEIVLEDAGPVPMYGVKRDDTDEVLVAAGTAMTRLDVGQYRYILAEPEPDLAYTAVIKFTQGGVANYVVRHYGAGAGGGGVPTGNKTLQFCVARAGALVVIVSPDLPRLSSPSGSYGIKRNDTNETILAAGVAMTPLAGDKMFVHTFVEPAENLRYKYYVELILDGVTYHVPSVTYAVNSAMLAIGRYTDSLKIGSRYGHDNMHLWLSVAMADIEEPVDYALRAYEFIKRAEQQIDEKIYGPWVNGAFVDNASVDPKPIPETVIRCATELAGVLMYEARGVDDSDPENPESPPHRLSRAKKDVMMTLRKIQMGLLRVDGSASLSPLRAPTAGGFEVPVIDTET